MFFKIKKKSSGSHYSEDDGLADLAEHYSGPCLHLLYQSLYYSVEDGGEIRTPETGVPRGCALSPLTGAVLLWHMDRYFGCQTGQYYLRYMDDYLLLARHRWPLKRAIRDGNQYLRVAGFTCPPDKRQLGRLSRGFDWCGIECSPPNPPRISVRLLIKHRERCQRLDEQLRARGLSDKDRAARVHAYRTRWTIWAHSLVKATK
ncbi:reverse transcriptase domain-containing protein [Pantoea ananatis]|uniref:reverse transcriptase domain-containing protein n=1 Tax=Pantoea ananas TaxID=553 RepID=UPI003AF31C48